MKRFFAGTIVAAMCVGLFAMTTVHAAPEFYTDVQEQTVAASKEEGAGFRSPRDPREAAALMIRGALTLVGIIFVGYTVYAGVVILTAGGDSSKVDKGKSTLRTAIIGVIITLSAYTIVTFVTTSIISSASPAGEVSSSTFSNWRNWFRGDARSGLDQRRYNNRDPLNQPAITPFE